MTTTADDDDGGVKTPKMTGSHATAQLNFELAVALADRLINEAKNSRKGIEHGMALRAVARKCRHAAECFSLWTEPGVEVSLEARFGDLKMWSGVQAEARALGVR